LNSEKKKMQISTNKISTTPSQSKISVEESSPRSSNRAASELFMEENVQSPVAA
jgi:hypothetical protein